MQAFYTWASRLARKVEGGTKKVKSKVKIELYNDHFENAKRKPPDISRTALDI